MNSIAPDYEIITTKFKEFSLGEQTGLKKQIENIKPDLVHFPMVQQPIFYRGRVVTSMLDLTTLRFKNPVKNKILYSLKQQVYKFVNLRAAKKSKIIICISEYVKNDIVKFARIPSEKIIVTYNAAELIHDDPKAIEAIEGKQFIMYIGRPLPHKNLDRLIEAFAQLQRTYSDLYLVLAGKKDTLYEAHEQNVLKKGIKNVIFTGFVSDGELRWLYEHTACYVFPSLSEGFGLPGLEAMAHGAPVASSNATCLPEVYGDAAVYFDPNNSGAVAGAVHDVLNDHELAKQLKQKGFVQAQKYSWERMARQTLEAYEKALSL